MANKKTADTPPPQGVDNPQTAEEFAENGWFLYSRKLFDQSETSFRRSLDLDPDNPDVMYALGMCLDAANKPQEAVSAFQDVIEYLTSHQNDDTQVRNNMLVRLSRGHISRIKTGEWHLES